jgi:very-short-patch-repair endonuclease
MAAIFACGRDAAISHRSAARLWKLIEARPKDIEVTVRRAWRPARPGIRVYATRFLTNAEVRRIQRIPVTSPARTILDLAASTPTDELERIVAEAYAQRLVGKGELVGVLERNRGRTGAAPLRRLVEGDGDPARIRSRAEHRLLKLLRASPLPAPETNGRVGPHEIDLLWREERLAVEFDSWSFHSGRPKFERDRIRDAELQARGYRVIRVTWRQLTRDPAAVVARLEGFLGERGISPT